MYYEDPLTLFFSSPDDYNHSGSSSICTVPNLDDQKDGNENGLQRKHKQIGSIFLSNTLRLMDINVFWFGAKF